MKNNRAQFSTTEQEREMYALTANGVIQHPAEKRFDRIVRLRDMKEQREVVTVYVAEPVAHQVALSTLRAAGFPAHSDGIKILYLG